jgi:hypothetical protein
MEQARIERLGDVLEAAARSDLATNKRPRRRLVAAAVAAVVLLPAAAVAGAKLISNDDVARSLPAGTLSLAGTEPACTAVEDGVEYRCVLAKAPAPEVSDWKGTVEPSVDTSKHVNGGCRSLASDGREWECYIGQAAVDQKIIGQSFLGQFAPSPGVG